jgi:hypothetical protein
MSRRLATSPVSVFVDDRYTRPVCFALMSVSFRDVHSEVYCGIGWKKRQ